MNRPVDQQFAETDCIRHQIVRARHETRRRMLVVNSVKNLTPRMRRIRFASPDLADFRSASPDDHIRLFFPRNDGDGEGHAKRDFTPRAFNNEEKTLTIDFALHDRGLATEWAASAQVGQTLEIGGPRKSSIVSDDFDWYLFVGDESALPAIGRWVESLRPGVPVMTVVAVADQHETQTFATRASWQPEWVIRGEPSERDSQLLSRIVSKFVSSDGDGFVWVAGEAFIAHDLRARLVEKHGHPVEWLKTAAYWHRSTDRPSAGRLG